MALIEAVDWSADLGGGTRVALVQAGTFRSDAGALFGPVPRLLWDRLVVDEIEAELRATGNSEVPSSRVGSLAMQKLRALDHIAYIRFASVYQSFEDLEDLKREVDTLYEQRDMPEDSPG